LIIFEYLMSYVVPKVVMPRGDTRDTCRRPVSGKCSLWNA
jgi:hypothetical protein